MIPEILASIGQGVWIISYIPQLWRTYKTKNVEGVSIWTYIWFLMGYLTILPLLIQDSIHPLVEGYIITTIMVIVEIGMILKYRKNGKKI